MNHSSSLIGVVGGFGPDTTAEFCCQLIAQARQLNPYISPAFVVDFVAVPSATAALAIRGDSQAARSLVASINGSLQRLYQAGARTFVFPCNTMHAFAAHFAVPTGGRFLHIVDQVVQELREQCVQVAGVLATGLTVQAGLYATALTQANIAYRVPNAHTQQELSEHIAHFHATGTVRSQAADCLRQALSALAEQGAERVVLGCTDIGGMLRLSGIVSPIPYTDSVTVLARTGASLCMLA